MVLGIIIISKPSKTADSCQWYYQDKPSLWYSKSSHLFTKELSLTFQGLACQAGTCPAQEYLFASSILSSLECSETKTVFQNFRLSLQHTSNSLSKLYIGMHEIIKDKIFKVFCDEMPLHIENLH